MTSLNFLPPDRFGKFSPAEAPLQSGSREFGFRILVGLFLLSCVFDPADLLLGLKLWLFLAVAVIGIGGKIASHSIVKIPGQLIIYVSVFVAIPLFSVMAYIFNNPITQFEGFNLLKGYLLIGLAPVLVVRRLDLIPMLAFVLTGLAIAILLVSAMLAISPGMLGAVTEFGKETGIVFVDKRSYSGNFSMQQVYFVTSPMLVISIGYYMYLARSAEASRKRNLYWIITLINVAAMIFAGTRNNIFVGLLLPFTIIFLQSRNKFIGVVFVSTIIIGLMYTFSYEIAAFLNPAEVSNNIKLALLDDYAEMLSDPLVFIFGQGLGAYQYWYARGSFDYITELTYLELIRNFGIFGAIIMMYLLFHPIRLSFQNHRSIRDRIMAISFGYYLIMCISNPNLYSSMGILILSIMMANLYAPQVSSQFRVRKTRKPNEIGV